MARILRTVKRAIKLTIILAVFAGAALAVQFYVKRHPEDFPWTELALDQPVGMFTLRKIAKLEQDFDQCQALLDEAGIQYTLLPEQGQASCRRDDNLVLKKSNIAYAPSVLAPSCPVVAALAVWERQIVQAAAQQYFGQGVKSIRHLGVYNCRKIAGGSSWSEHATGNAIDIAGFTLMDGSQITLAGDWSSEGKKAAFLRAVRDGSCDLFATVLSPEYNAAHADHFHLDQAGRGISGYGVCR